MVKQNNMYEVKMDLKLVFLKFFIIFQPSMTCQTIEIWAMFIQFHSICPYEEKLCNTVVQLDNFTVHFRFGANQEDKSIMRSNPLW